MKILAISNYVGDPKKKYDSAIHLWRIKRPLLELQKHVDWQIDWQTNIVRDFKGLDHEPDEFIRKHGTDEVKHLGQYDVIFGSYFTSPHIYTLLWAAEKKYGTKFILDFDDDLFDVDPGNFAFWKSAGRSGHEFLGIIARITKYICTTNKALADKLRDRSESNPEIFTIPNYISDMYPERSVDNGERVYIGFFGGASHYTDVHHSGLLPALEKLMHENKNVYVKMCGQPADHYLPKARVEQVEVAHGVNWPTKRLPSLNLDIACAPLLDTEFNKYKSQIKWQEATRMGSAFVGSMVGPYRTLSPKIARLVPNTQDAWYIALKELVDNVEKRKTMVQNAKAELKKWRLEEHWQAYKEMFEGVHNAD